MMKCSFYLNMVRRAGRTLPFAIHPRSHAIFNLIYCAGIAMMSRFSATFANRDLYGEARNWRRLKSAIGLLVLVVDTWIPNSPRQERKR